MGNDFNRVEQLRSLFSGHGSITYGKPNDPDDNFFVPLFTSVCVFIAAFIVAFVGFLAFGKGYIVIPATRAFTAAVVVSIIYWLFPVWGFVVELVEHRSIPTESFLDKYNSDQKFFTCALFGLGLTLAINYGAAKALTWWHINYHVNFHDFFTGHALFNGWLVFPKWLFGLIWIFSITLFVKLFSCLLNQTKQEVPRSSKTTYRDFFRLWVGTSTGQLASLYHKVGIAPRQQVTLSLEDAAQNILILGAIGSGKTTRAIHPLLIQLLDQECGGLIFDIKGDFKDAVLTFAAETERDVVIIGVNHSKMNLLAGLTPEVAASFLKSVFVLNSPNRNDTFWIDTASELCRNTLGILSFFPKHYSLHGLYSYLFDLEARVAIDEQVHELLPNLDDKKRRLLTTYWQYHERIFDRFEEKVKAGVNATVAQVLSSFNHPELIDAFCTEDEEGAHMEEVLDGAVYLVELPLATWGLGGKVVYTMIKLRFFNVMQQRLSHPDWDKERPVFFMCDEFQEIVSANRDGLSDLNFWDKSRSSKTIGIISAQAISSFYAAIGDRDIASALLQNFRQKLCFKTEDTITLNYFNSLADKVEIKRNVTSYTSNDKLFKSDGNSTTASTTFVERPVLDGQLFRSLQPAQAVAMLSIGNQSMDDVVNTLAVYGVAG